MNINDTINRDDFMSFFRNTEKLNELLLNSTLYSQMSENALAYSKFFCEDYFENESTRILSN